MLEIREASSGEMHLVRGLFLEYAGSLEFDLEFQGFREELDALPGTYSPPRGRILLAFNDSESAGCVAIRPLGDFICEMKRLYVRPKFLGQRIGRRLADKIVEKAAQIGYEKIRLDTVPSMKAAIRTYLSMGFYPIPPYRENPVPGTSYLQKDL